MNETNALKGQFDQSAATEQTEAVDTQPVSQTATPANEQAAAVALGGLEMADSKENQEAGIEQVLLSALREQKAAYEAYTPISAMGSRALHHPDNAGLGERCNAADEAVHLLLKSAVQDGRAMLHSKNYVSHEEADSLSAEGKKYMTFTDLKGKRLYIVLANTPEARAMAQIDSEYEQTAAEQAKAKKAAV